MIKLLKIKNCFYGLEKPYFTYQTRSPKVFAFHSKAIGAWAGKDAGGNQGSVWEDKK